MSDRNMRCRWCGTGIILPIPENEELRKIVLAPLLKVSCNRCADYHRERVRSKELLQEQALCLTRFTGESKLSVVRDAIRRTVVKIIQNAEEFYLLSGLQGDVAEFVDGVSANPQSAALMADMFERGVRDVAKETHGV